MCFTTVVTIVSAKLYELVEVFVPNIKCLLWRRLSVYLIGLLQQLYRCINESKE